MNTYDNLLLLFNVLKKKVKRLSDELKRTKAELKEVKRKLKNAKIDM